MKLPTRLLLGALLSTVTIAGCDPDELSNPLNKGDTNSDADPDSGPDPDADTNSNTEVDTDADTVTGSEVGAANGLTGVYFNDMRLTDKVLERRDSSIDFDWEEGSPGPGVDRDTFSVRWTGSIEPRYSETYTFTIESDDGVKLWIDGKQIISNWNDHSLTEDQATIELEAGKHYGIKLEFYDNTMDATIRLFWSSGGQSKEIVPSSQLFKHYDLCPDDPDKTEPGECGCGVPETDCEHQPPSQGRESYDGPWGGKHVKLRDVWEENWSEGLSSREKYLLVSNNDCNQSRVKEHAQANGFLFLAQEGNGDAGATLLEVQANSQKDGLKAILDVGKITITAVTTDGTLIPEGGGGDHQHDENRMAFGSTDNTNTGGGVYHLDLQPQNEDGVTIWDRDHPCKSFRGGFMYLRWE